GPVGFVDNSTFGYALFDQIADAFDLDGRDQRTNIHGFVQRVAHPKLGHTRPDLGQKTLFDRFLHQQTRTRATDLALIEPDGFHQTLDSAIEVGILKNDVGGFSTKFEAEPLARPRGGGANDLAHFGGAGKGNLVYVGMVDDGRPGIAFAGNDIDHALGKANPVADFGKEQGRQRRE